MGRLFISRADLMRVLFPGVDLNPVQYGSAPQEVYFTPTTTENEVREMKVDEFELPPPNPKKRKWRQHG